MVYDLGHSTTSARQARPINKAAGLKLCRCLASVAIWAKKSAGSLSISKPSRSLNCDRPISTAMPLVKPITMDTGM